MHHLLRLAISLRWSADSWCRKRSKHLCAWSLECTPRVRSSAGGWNFNESVSDCRRRLFSARRIPNTPPRLSPHLEIPRHKDAWLGRMHLNLVSSLEDYRNHSVSAIDGSGCLPPVLLVVDDKSQPALRFSLVCLASKSM